MAINFPSSPSTNDTYSYGGKTWRFNGVAWEIYSSGNIGNITVTGNVTAGNILTDNYFFSNGDPFVSSNYGNADVATYLTEYTGNITAGNILTDNYFYANGDPFTSYTDTDVQTLLTGNITVGNVTVTGTIDGYATTSYVDTEVANLVNAAPSTLDTLNELATALGNDSAFSTTVTSLIGNNTSNIATIQSQIANLNYYDDANVTTFLSDIGSNNISTTGDITANSFIGDGSQLTGLPASYTDANVADYLPTYTGNITAGNIISDYFIGNGSQISGVTSSATISFGNTAPISPAAGDFWIDSDTGKQFIYFDDGDSSQWIQLATTTSISVGGNYGNSDVLSYLGNVSGNIIPSTNVTYTLGNSTNQWHSLYVGPGSLYVNNKKVIEDSSGKITVSTSVNQNLAITTSGTGDIELFPDGTGVINLQGNVQADSGVILSGTGGLKFGSNLNLDNNNINNLDDPVQAQDAATKAYVDAEIASAQGNYSDSNVASYLPTYTGNLTAGNITVTGTIDGYATTTYVGTEIANLVNSAPSTLDTLNELASALGNDAAFSTTVTSLIGNNTSNIATIQSQVTALEANTHANLQSNVNTLESDVTTLQGNITTIEGNITTIESQITALEANTHANLESNVTTLESQITNLNYYDDANVTTFLSDIGSNNISTTGDITANSFIGDGSQLTGLPESYSNANVATYLTEYTGNITAGNILTDNYFYANGDAFVSGGGGGGNVTVSNTAPTSPSSGDIWVDSDTGREYTYINDGDSSQFIEFGTPSIDIGTNKTTLPIFNFPTNIDSNLTIESGFNGLSVGPITQANNTVISINAGQRWIIL